MKPRRLVSTSLYCPKATKVTPIAKRRLLKKLERLARAMSNKNDRNGSSHCYLRLAGAVRTLRAPPTPVPVTSFRRLSALVRLRVLRKRKVAPDEAQPVPELLQQILDHGPIL
jgi:hypothetical protein